MTKKRTFLGACVLWIATCVIMALAQVGQANTSAAQLDNSATKAPIGLPNHWDCRKCRVGDGSEMPAPPAPRPTDAS